MMSRKEGQTGGREPDGELPRVAGMPDLPLPQADRMGRAPLPGADGRPGVGTRSRWLGGVAGGGSRSLLSTENQGKAPWEGPQAASERGTAPKTPEWTPKAPGTAPQTAARPPAPTRKRQAPPRPGKRRRRSQHRRPPDGGRQGPDSRPPARESDDRRRVNGSLTGSLRRPTPPHLPGAVRGSYPASLAKFRGFLDRAPKPPRVRRLFESGRCPALHPNPVRAGLLCVVWTRLVLSAVQHASLSTNSIVAQGDSASQLLTTRSDRRKNLLYGPHPPNPPTSGQRRGPKRQGER